MALDPSAPARSLISPSAADALPRDRRVRAGSGQRWSLDDIPWHEIRHEPVTQSRAFFFLVASASLMESATDLYTQNLIEFFAGDDEVTSWLERCWLPEELQHGRALRRYVEAAWPQFDWDATFHGFVEEFRPFCDVALEASHSLELASRCVVETGTASYYTTLSRASPERVLARLARHIAADEVRHYKYFYRFFRKYRDAGRPSRFAVAPALWRRLRMSGGQDGRIVVKHVHGARYSGVPFDTKLYRDIRRECRDLVGDHFPHEMAVRMLLKPLALGSRAQHVLLPVALALARRLVP